MISVLKGLWRKYTLKNWELDQDNEFIDDCPCCGNKTHRVLGFIHEGESTLAAYCIKWTEGHESKDAPWFIITMGAWGDGTSGENRLTAGCLLIENDKGQTFHVVDAATIESRPESLVGRHLTHDEVLGGKIKNHLFKIIDKIVFYDPRIQVLFGQKNV